MSRKFKSIEFFGISGSGKTHIASNVKQNLEKNGFIVLNSRECIIKGAKDCININLIEKISLNYFKLINLKNVKKKSINTLKKKSNFHKNNNSINANYLKTTYLQICKRISAKNRKFNSILKKVEKMFLNPSQKEQQYLFWFYELVASHIVFKKIFKSKKYILLLDEGLIQRSFIISNKLSQKKRNKFFNLYFTQLPISKLIFYISSKKKVVLKVNKFRKSFQLNKYKDLNEIKKNYKFLNEYLLSKKKFNFKKIDNYKNVEEKIKKILN